MLPTFLLKFLISLTLATPCLAIRCMDCMESRITTGENELGEPGFPREPGSPGDPTTLFLSNCSVALNTTSCPRGCFTLRVSQGGSHYGVPITNHLVHRGCQQGGEDTTCDLLTNHLEPITIGDVSCSVELCETKLCNVDGEGGDEENFVVENVVVYEGEVVDEGEPEDEEIVVVVYENYFEEDEAVVVDTEQEEEKIVEVIESKGDVESETQVNEDEIKVADTKKKSKKSKDKKNKKKKKKKKKEKIKAKRNSKKMEKRSKSKRFI